MSRDKAEVVAEAAVAAAAVAAGSGTSTYLPAAEQEINY